MFDLAVIGGGISGLGVALEASAKRLNVALIERDKIAAKTSANSLRIIHGGLRYLQHLNIPRAVNSIKAQAELLELAPDFIKPIECVLPLSKFGMRSKIPASIGLAIYRALSKSAIGRSAAHRIVSAEFLDDRIPILQGCAPFGGLLWTDAFMPDPDGFALFLKGKAVGNGARIFEDSGVSAIERAPDRFLISCGASDGPIEAKAVINTCGPWINSVRPESNEWFGRVSWCRAFNIVVKRQLEPHYAFGLTAVDGRALFVVPRGEHSAIGTWYIPFKGDPTNAGVTQSEVDLLLHALNEALPAAQLARQEVISIECGVLPMQRNTPHGPELYGSEQIVASAGYVEVLSTKYTTFLTQARKVLATLNYS